MPKRFEFGDIVLSPMREQEHVNSATYEFIGNWELSLSGNFNPLRLTSQQLADLKTVVNRATKP